MLITPERVFYAGLLGRPRGRSSGALHIYVALEGTLRLSCDGRDEAGLTILALPPYLPHTLAADHPAVICMTLEPESLQPGVAEALLRRIEGPEGPVLASRMRAALAQLRAAPDRAGLTSADLDTLLFGAPLPPRRLDPRIAAAVAGIVAAPGEALTAADCAAAAGLSPSRFLHLFKDETGISFRAMRAWKRARHLLHYVNEDINLAHLAQDIGYPDSTHFSHSIRRFYGLKPRAIFTGSRDLAILRSAPPARQAALA
jgi:AraC-like DNA-binding protein